VHDSLGKVRGVLGNGSQDVGSSLLVESVLLGKRVDELGKDLVGDDSFGKLIRVVGETAESKSSGLLD